MPVLFLLQRHSYFIETIVNDQPEKVNLSVYYTTYTKTAFFCNDLIDILSDEYYNGIGIVLLYTETTTPDYVRNIFSVNPYGCVW